MNNPMRVEVDCFEANDYAAPDPSTPDLFTLRRAPWLPHRLHPEHSVA